MTDRTSYPSPDAAATRAGAPFYPNAGALSPTGHVPDLNLHSEHDHDDKVTAALAQHLNEHYPVLQDTSDHTQDPNLMQIDNDQDHHAQVMAREVMSLDAHGNQVQMHHLDNTPHHDDGLSHGAMAFPSMKPRSKVSRACDECRRKKVSKPLGLPTILAK
jgi:hypothetical protein